jgi:hypothetical protein
MGGTSLAVLYSRHWGSSHCQSLGVGMPWVGVLQLPSRVPPKAGTTCAYLSWSVSTVKPNHLPRNPGGKPYAGGTVGVPVDILLTL